MDKWRLAHDYMKSSAVPPILCPDDATPLYVVDGGDDPALRCMACATTYRPGTDVWKTMEENLNG